MQFSSESFRGTVLDNWAQDVSNTATPAAAAAATTTATTATTTTTTTTTPATIFRSPRGEIVDCNFRQRPDEHCNAQLSARICSFRVLGLMMLVMVLMLSFTVLLVPI